MWGTWFLEGVIVHDETATVHIIGACVRYALRNSLDMGDDGEPPKGSADAEIAIAMLLEVERHAKAERTAQ